jgi:hypothetical protein
LVAQLRPPGSAAYLFFDWEYDWIRYWRARREGAAEAAALLNRQRAHPLTARPEHQIAALALADRDAGPLEALRAQLQGIVGDGIAENAPLIVDISRQRLHRRRSAELLSANLCTAFELVHVRGSVSLEEMALACFGIRRFDPLVHGPRISNLLTRMRRFAPPGLNFHIRSGQVHAVGNWDGVRFLRPQPLVQALRDEPEWKLWIRRDAPVEPSPRNDKWVPAATLLRKVQPGTELRREDLERLTGKSRSSMNRLIANWLEQGLLRKSGRARRTRYTVSKNPKELS